MPHHSRALSLLIPLIFSTPAIAQTSTTQPPKGAELSWSSAASRIGAFTSRAWAKRGKGVTIAVVDTGLRRDHTEFKDALTGGYNAFTGATGASAVVDTNGHGSHVASLAAGRANGVGMAGVASLAGILPIQVFQGPTTTSSLVSKGIAYATAQKAFVINLSLGAPSPDTSIRSAMQAAQKAGQLMVVAAGNEGAANPSWPARHASESWANGQIIAVGAVDATNKIASFSNRAGDARNFYLVAPGTGLIGAYHTSPTAYASMSGTSMASPIVAGAAAVIKSAWPYLTARNTAEILFRTATDLGDKGVDATYGRGLLNLEKALLPVGGVTAIGATGAAPLALAPATSGQVTSGARTAAAAAGLFTGAVFDSFGRDFGFDFGRLNHSPRSDSVITLDNSLNERMGGATNARPASGRYLETGLRRRFDSIGEEAAQRPLGVMMFQSGRTGRWAVSSGSSSPILDLATAPKGTPAPRLTGYHGHTVLFGPEAVTLAAANDLTPNLRLRFGGRLKETGEGVNGLTGVNEVTGRATGLEAGLAYRTDRLSLSADISRISETGSRLGDIEAAAFSLRGRANTTALNLSAGVRLGQATSLTGHVTGMVSDAQNGALGSLVQDVSRTNSLGYSVNLARNNLLVSGDSLEVSAGTPLTSRSGAMSMVLAVGADPVTGAPIMADRRISLKGPALERRLEMSYVRPIARDGSLGVALLSRFDADGTPGREDHSALVRFIRRF